MTKATWVVQTGLLRAGIRGPLPFSYASPLYDSLTTGPQHADAEIEQRLRHAAGLPSDLDVLDAHEQLLEGDLVLLVEGELTRVLGALWWIDVMSQRGADVRSVRLATVAPFPRASVVVQAVRDATAIGDDLEPLRALRRAIVDDTDAISLPLEALSEARRPWAALSDRIRDLLPDARGLDLIDAALVRGAGAEWSPMARIVADSLAGQASAHRWGDAIAFERFIELAEDRPAPHPRDVRDDHEPTALLELHFEGPIAMRFARVRRTRFGDEVLAGRDALETRAFDRWVGGRFLTRDRIMRADLRRG